MDNTSTANMLLAHGANVDTRDLTGMSALAWACQYGFFDYARLLVDHGADVNQRSNDGLTLIQHVPPGKGKEIIRLLIEHGAPRE
jgi:ankyrin repeat protein